METVGFFHSEEPSTRIVAECESLKSEGRRRRKKMVKGIVMILMRMWFVFEWKLQRQE